MNTSHIYVQIQICSEFVVFKTNDHQILQLFVRT